MEKRPTSVTVISWILIVLGVISLVTTLVTINNPLVREMMAKSPIPVPIQFVMTYFGLLVMLGTGAFMLRGKAWARTLYVAWIAISFLVGVFTSPMKAAMIPGFVVSVVITFFLFRPRANKYFSQSAPPDDGEGIQPPI